MKRGIVVLRNLTIWYKKDIRNMLLGPGRKQTLLMSKTLNHDRHQQCKKVEINMKICN